MSKGKFYFEITGTTWATGGYLGLANGTAVLSTVAGNGTNCAYLTFQGVLFVNNANVGNILGQRASSNIIGIAFDLAGRLIWLRVAPAGNWNGSGTADPATATGGINIATIGGAGVALYGLYCAGAVASMSMTANFGDTAFSGTVPVGFTAGLPDGVASTQARAMVLA